MSVKQKIVSPIVMWIIVASGIAIVFWSIPARWIFSRNIFSALLLPVALFCWSYFFIGALVVHRKAALSAEKIDRIIEDGVYGKVRHPIYAADIFLSWSIFFFYPDVRLLISAHWLMFVLLYWVHLEEKTLINKFGKTYMDYIRRVPKLFPKI